MQPIENDNIALWQKLKDGNVEALGLLYDIFIDDLFIYGSQFSPDRQKIMDSIHDVFLNLFKYRDKLASTDNVKYYLFRSLKNQILKESKSKLQFTSDIRFFDTKNIFNSVPSYEDELIEFESLDKRDFKLTNALSCLTKKQKQCIALRFNDDLQYEEIAEIMNVSVQTSRTIIYRAIKLLRSNLTLPIFFYSFFL